MGSFGMNGTSQKKLITEKKKKKVYSFKISIHHHQQH